MRSSYDALVTHAPPPLRNEHEYSRRYAPLFAGLPAVVWALCLVFVASMLFWSIAKATYKSPDERQHVSAALYWSEFREWPRFKEMGMMLDVMRSADLARSAPRDASAATARPERPSFADLAGDAAISDTTINQMSQHPPLYYMLLGQVHELLPSDIAADLEVWIMRVVSIVLMAPLPLLAAALARRLGASRPIVITVAAVVALTPGFATLGGAVNNDNLLNAASAWALLGVGCVLTGDLRARTAIWIGAALAVALMTKAFAIPIAVGVALAYVVATVRFRDARAGLTSLAVVIAVAALGGWWWIQNLLRYGTLQPAGHGDPLPDGPLSVMEALPVYADRFAEVFFSRFWLGLDAPGFGHPSFWIPATLSIVLLAILLAGPFIVRRSLQPHERVDLVVLITPFVFAAVILFSSTFRITMNTGYAAGIQGRYLYCAVIALVVVAGLVLAALVPAGLHPIVMLAVTLLGLALAAWRMITALTAAWAPGEPGLLAHVEALLAWSPLPYAASVSVLVLVVAASVLVIVLVVREYLALQRPDAGIRGEHDEPAVRRSVARI